MKNPILLSGVLDKEDYAKLISSVSDPKSFDYQEGFSRYIASDSQLEILKELSDKLTPLARETFKSKTLLPTYTLFSHYEGQDPKPSLYRHRDDNACTYTLDMCVYQNEPWDLWVEDEKYTLYPNQALAYYGNDQVHWREAFPNPETNYVAMIFFHFAEPDHWYFTKGPEYLNVIRNIITEEEFDKISSTRS